MSNLKEIDYGAVIDPPDGWKYGFPMQFKPKLGERIKDFIIRNGYPEDQADFACEHMRFWYET